MTYRVLVSIEVEVDDENPEPIAPIDEALTFASTQDSDHGSIVKWSYELTEAI